MKYRIPETDIDIETEKLTSLAELNKVFAQVWEYAYNVGRKQGQDEGYEDGLKQAYREH